MKWSFVSREDRATVSITCVNEGRVVRSVKGEWFTIYPLDFRFRTAFGVPSLHSTLNAVGHILR